MSVKRELKVWVFNVVIVIKTTAQLEVGLCLITKIPPTERIFESMAIGGFFAAKRTGSQVVAMSSESVIC